MEQVTIKIALPVSTAIRQAAPQAGAGEWPAAGVYPLLDDEDRVWLANRADQRFELAAAASDETVAAAIKAARAAEAATAAAFEAEVEARTQRALARPDEAWIVSRAYLRLAPCAGVPDHADDSDPRIEARLADVEARVLPPLVAEWEAKRAAQQAAEQAAAERKATEAAQRAARHAAVTAWAAGEERLPENIRRGAAEGVDAFAATKRFLCTAIEGVILDAVGSIGGSIVETYGPAVERESVASETAYEIRDALDAAIPAITAAALLPDVRVEIPRRFLQVDVCAEPHTEYRCAVDVRVTHPWFGDLGQHVLTEPGLVEDEEVGS